MIIMDHSYFLDEIDAENEIVVNQFSIADIN